MIAAICARADVWLRRAVRMAGEVTDRALRIPYVKGTVAFRQYFSPSPLCRPAVSPRERSEGVRPASLARIFLITVQSGVTGITQRTATRTGRAAVRDAIRAGILIRPTRCDRVGRPEEQSTGS